MDFLFLNRLFSTEKPDNVGSGCFRWNATGQNGEQFSKVCSKLEEVGFSMLQNQNIGKYRFVTYGAESVTVCVSYWETEGVLEVIADTLMPTAPYLLKPQKTEHSHTPKCSMPTLAINGVPRGAGMSFVLTLNDGKFIVIDGGYAENASGLYEFLKENTDEGQTPTIAAWVVTHGHEDHCGCVLAFADSFCNKVKVEKLVCNPYVGKSTVDPLEDLLTEDSVSKLSSQFNCDIVRPHFGQKLYFGETSLLFLHTQEQVFGNCEWLNTSSLAFLAEIDETKIYFPCDFEEPFITKIGDGISCDIIQVTHHGCSGGIKEEYDILQPKIAFFPIGQPYIEERLSEDYPYASNYYLVNMVEKYFSDNCENISLELK